MNITYHPHRDYLLPDISLCEQDNQPIGKFGLMRLDYLQKERPGLFTRLLLSGKLMSHLHEIDRICHERLIVMLPEMKAAEGVTEELKAADQMEWVKRMNSIQDRIEEILRDELIFV